MGARTWALPAAAIGAAAAATLLLAAPAPGYDAWAWLLWGREIAYGGLSTPCRWP
jgi:hypothetical protein